MINGQDIGLLDGIETVLQDGDKTLMLPPMAEGLKSGY